MSTMTNLMTTPLRIRNIFFITLVLAFALLSDSASSCQRAQARVIEVTADSDSRYKIAIGQHVPGDHRQSG